MKRAISKNYRFMLILITLVFTAGCAGMQSSTNPNKHHMYYPVVLVQADSAIENARSAGKDQACPFYFAEAEKMRDDAYDVYHSCNEEKAIMLAAEAKDMADMLCPSTMPALLPVPKAEVKTERVVVDRMTLHLHFNFDKATIKQEDYPKLKEGADFINRYPDASVLIEGHTDNAGDDDYNHTLSHKRADSVKSYLYLNEGIKAANVSASGQGELMPVYSNDTTWGRAQNRRVEILILK